ncbi:hypothetical protein BJX61DRAFT_547095 [Aspergillus egyptiacus]|nr:hypothetical protein BJX61DRAFT_547095 [Aspergillus egyptiacus]
MLHVFVGPDNPPKSFSIGSSLLTGTTTFPSLVLPIDSFDNGIQNLSFDPPVTLVKYPDIFSKCEPPQMDSQSGHIEQCSGTPNGIPNADALNHGFHTGKEQDSHWQACFPMLETGRSDLSNTVRRSASGSPHQFVPHGINHSSPGNQLTLEDPGSSNGKATTPELIHPIPRQSPCTVTNYFVSEKVSETASIFDATERTHESHLSNESKYFEQGSDWTANDLAYPCFQDKQSLITSSATTVADAYTARATGNTCDNPLVALWPHMKTQRHWNMQEHNANPDEDQALWTHSQAYVDQQHGQFDQLSVSTDSVNGLPWLDANDQAFIQPSSLLDPYKSTCPDLRYPNDNAVAPSEPGKTISQFTAVKSAANSAYETTYSRPDDTTQSLFQSFGLTASQSDNGRPTSWTIESKNSFLLECKRRGYSYKDIKRIGGFREAESTLRGRFRTLTKTKEQRVRKPHWHDNDIRLLCEAVNIYSDDNPHSLCAPSCLSRRPIQPHKVSWKKVAQYIWANGGSYHFGNATCKKKWCEVQSRSRG